jgi:hypothetical protein
LAFGLLTIVALVAQYIHRAHPTAFYTVNFFSYFTIESNLFATALLLYGAARGLLGGRRADSPGHDLLRGAAVLYMTITGLVYVLVLSGSKPAVPWANAVVHYAMPIVIVLDWLFDPPRSRLVRAALGRWLIFPLVFFAYTLIRGALVNWYPYPFLDAATKGYARVLANGVGVLLVMIAVGSGALWAGNGLRERRTHG